MPTTTKLLLASSLLAATAASAQPSETAESAAKRGDVAMKAKNVHEACEAYEISEHQSASAETEDKLAKCDEQDGKPIAAARYYRMHAKQDTDAKRKKASLAKADKLEAKAPKLRFAVNPNPPGLVIKVDGTEVPITGDVMVDIGPHTVTASAPGSSRSPARRKRSASAWLSAKRCAAAPTSATSTMVASSSGDGARVARVSAIRSASSVRPRERTQTRRFGRFTGVHTQRRASIFLQSGAPPSVRGDAFLLRVEDDVLHHLVAPGDLRAPRALLRLRPRERAGPAHP